MIKTIENLKNGNYSVVDNQGVSGHFIECLEKEFVEEIEQLAEQTYPAYKREHQRRSYLENIEVPRLEKENEQLKQQIKELKGE